MILIAIEYSDIPCIDLQTLPYQLSGILLLGDSYLLTDSHSNTEKCKVESTVEKCETVSMYHVGLRCSLFGVRI